MPPGQAFIVSPRKPSRCRPEDLAAFEALVLEGHEVDPNGLSRRVGLADTLLFAYDARTLIGIGALKRPGNGYRKGVFEKAGGKLAASAFPLELGWVYVIPTSRKSGVGQRIVDAILGAAVDRRLFATSRSDNGTMQRRLERSGFVREGKPFLSDMGDHMVVLFVRGPTEQHDL